jgi:hypothetical protein
MQESILQVHLSIPPIDRTDEETIYWRCFTDSIWEGRLAATRWLIEFIGIKQDPKGRLARAKPQKRLTGAADVRIDDIKGGRLFKLSHPHAKFLADVWKGCTQASSHATHGEHLPISDRKELPQSLTIVIKHLQDTIYDRAGKQLRDCVLRSKD